MTQPPWPFAVALIVLAWTAAAPSSAQERRAAPPKFDAAAFRGVFYADLSDVVSPSRPSARELRGVPRSPAAAGNAAAPSTPAAVAPAMPGDQPAVPSGSGWESLIRPTSLEDEVKRLKLRFDGVITAPGPFKSGGYQDARRDLSMLATLFAVIAQYEGDVRWKADAPAARDLLARTAFNAKSGSVQVYNEAKLRKADLQDLVSGAGLSNRDAEAQNDWSMVVDRAPLMEYLDEALEEHLKPHTANPQQLAEHVDEVRRYGEMVAVVGRVLTREGMDESDDEDYKALSTAMIDAAMRLRGALDREDAEAAREAVGAIGQSCTACHDQYR